MAQRWTRADIERREQEWLAPYAALAVHTRGRQHPQPEHPLRTAFQRDRDRIVHAAAFRRLEYKTQVFIPHETDHYRTRLTHTLEVAQISRTLARSLRLNEDLAEAVALVHDLGHTPFGHAGEDVLDRLLSDHGGFNHNRQSLRVVDVLEQRYAAHPGLNLTYEVREGIVKHETSVVWRCEDFDPDEHPTMEASLVDIADEIAYNAHDIDDGISAGLLTLDELAEEEFVTAMIGGGADSWQRTSPDDRRYELVRRLINHLVTDVIDETGRRLDEAGIGSLDDVRQHESKLVDYSTACDQQVARLKVYLKSQLYRHPALQRLTDSARGTIELLYERLTAGPEKLPRRFQVMLSDRPLELVVADYIAGMTDRYAEKMAAEG